MIMGYKNMEKKDGKGGPDEVEGNNTGPFVVPLNKDGSSPGPIEDYKSGKITSIGTSDATITPGWIFNYISIINTGNTTIILCVDKSTDDTPNTKLIYIPPGVPYNRPLRGEILHYKSETTGGEFIYVLEKGGDSE